MKDTMFILFLFTLLQNTHNGICEPCDGYDNLMVVAKEVNSTHMDNCWNINSTIYCNSLSKKMQSYIKNNMCILIKTNLVLQTSFTVSNIGRLKLTSTSVEIKCKLSENESCNDIGVSFVSSSNVIVSNLILNECGKRHYMQDSNDLSLNSALYFQNVTNVTLESVKVKNSFGYGVSLVDVSTEIKLTKVLVSWSKAIPLLINKTVKHEYSSGGGILFKYSKVYDHSGDKIILNSCNLFMNYISALSTKTIPDHLPFGKGGGLTVIMLGKFTNSKFIIDGEISLFEGNKAEWGGGVYMYFSQLARNNKFNFNKVLFMDNQAKFSGGAVYIVESTSNNNQITFSAAKFYNNKAMYGGGMSIVVMNNDNWNNPGDKVRLHGATVKTDLGNVSLYVCIFDNNNAMLGSAMHIQRVRVDFYNLEATNGNVLKDHNRNAGKGALYAYDSNLLFLGTSYVTYNNNTALILDCSDLSVNGNLYFENNTGFDGGALALYGHSQIILDPTSNLQFKNNNASNRGGAIFVMIPGPPFKPWKTTELQFYSCFFRFAESSDSSYHNFTGHVLFSRNYADENYGNDIYASSLQNCRQPYQMNMTEVITDWPNFEINKNDSRSILTHAIDMRVNNKDWIDVTPGKIFNATVLLIDERGNSVQGTIDVLTHSDNVSVETNPAFAVKDKSIKISLIGPENNSYNVVIALRGGVPVSKPLTSLRLGYCPFGYKFNKSEKCLCDMVNNLKKGIAECSPEELYLFPNRWVPVVESGIPVNVISHICPNGYCNKCNTKQSAIYCFYEKDKQCDSSRNQSSLLCSECKIGLSIPVGGEVCIDCNNTRNWIWVSVVIIFGLTVFVAVLLVFNLDIMSFYINGCLYSYQIIDILYAPGQKIDKFLQFVIGIAEFTTKTSAYPSLCLWNGMNNMQKLAYNYIIPFWMVITVFAAYLYAIYKPRTYLTKKRCLRAFTIIAVMAYSDLMRISFWLLNPVVIDGNKYLYIYAKEEFLGAAHLPYALTAIFVLIFFVIVPVLLLFSTPWLNNRRFGRLSIPFSYFQSIVTSFNYGLKDGYLWFPTFYCSCRLFVFSIGVFLPNEPFQYIILSIFCLIVCASFSVILPYKNKWYNTVETILLANLGIIAVFSLGTESVFKKKEKKTCQTIIWVLSYIPMFVVLVAVLYRALKKIKIRFHHRRQIGGRGWAPVPNRVIMDSDELEYHAYQD